VSPGKIRRQPRRFLELEKWNLQIPPSEHAKFRLSKPGGFRPSKDDPEGPGKCPMPPHNPPILRFLRSSVSCFWVVAMRPEVSKIIAFSSLFSLAFSPNTGYKWSYQKRARLMLEHQTRPDHITLAQVTWLLFKLHTLATGRNPLAICALVFTR
jgi:hypothetical protein